MWPACSIADSWEPPKMKRYFSTNGEYFLEVVPTKISDKYWQWRQAKPDKKAKFKPEDTTIVHCHAKLFKIQLKDTIKVWEQKLINEMKSTQ